MEQSDPNPYESPKEAGYDNPLVTAFRAWRKDRLMLIGCGLSVLIIGWAGLMFCWWLLWLLGIAPA